MTNQSRNQSDQTCLLGDAEFRKRRAEISGMLRSLGPRIVELSDGYEMHFTPIDDLIDTLLEFIRFERKCCPFLHFQMSLTPPPGAIVLKLHGPGGTKATLEGWFLGFSAGGMS